MHELDGYSRRAILRWIKQHKIFAEPLLSRTKGDPCRSLADEILGCLVEMTAHLERGRYDQPELRRRELVLESVNAWKKMHPTRREPPQDVWRALDSEASRRAFQELYPRLAQLGDEIAKMRTKAETEFKC